MDAWGGAAPQTPLWVFRQNTPVLRRDLRTVQADRGLGVALVAESAEPIDIYAVVGAAARHCADVLVIGECADGKPYYAATTGDKALILWWIEQFKHDLLAGNFDICKEELD